MEKWILGFLGWLIYNSIILSLAKDPADAKGSRFNFKVYWRKTWDNAWVAFIIMIAWTWKGPELLGIHDSGQTWNDAMYLLSPVVVQIAINWYKKVSGNEKA